MAIEWSNLDFDNIGAWPKTAKAMFIFVICAVLLFSGYWFDIRKQSERMERFEKKEKILRQTYIKKHEKATNLDAYIEQLGTIKDYFGALLRQLPESTEVPGLVEDISHIGLANGLSFKFIKLKSEKQRDFYAELPIEISVMGDYHQLAKFVSDIASLPRIVTLHDFTIGPAEKNKGGEQLIMEVVAKTYRYTALDEEEAL